MRPIDVLRLTILGALWGGSFIFIRVAAPVMGAIATADARVVIAGAALLAYAAVIRANLETKQRWRQYLIVGLLNSAAPFTLISWSEVQLTASMAAILNATTPFFGAVVAAIWLRERLTTAKLFGIVIAFVGVLILVGWSHMKADLVTVLAIAASLAGALSYGIAATYAKINTKGASPMGLAVGSQVSASIFLTSALPFGLPAQHPTNAALLSVLVLALASTAVAYVLFFRLLMDVGPTKTLTVTFLVPVFGMLWGCLFIGEALTWTKVLACAIILFGAALVTGVIESPKRARTAIVPE